MMPNLKKTRIEIRINIFFIISILKVILDFPLEFNALIFNVYNGTKSPAKHNNWKYGTEGNHFSDKRTYINGFAAATITNNAGKTTIDIF